MVQIQDIPTYFSHSYRLEDQDLNQAFWRLFSKAGFSFFVDPPSGSAIHTHLERMMRRCSAFVAVVNRRQNVQRFHCSRFILYEYGLAIQARRPKLLLIDNTIPDEPFRKLPPEQTHYFSSADPLRNQDKLLRKIASLREEAHSFPNRRDRSRGAIALMVPPKRERSGYASRRMAARIAEVAAPAGFQIEECEVPYEHNAFFALDLDQYEAVILDVRSDALPAWVFAYVHGRLIPTIKLARLRPTELPDQVELPPLVMGLRMDEREPGVESVTYWRDEADLIWQLQQAFFKLDEEQTTFKSGTTEGLAYFRSIGRRPARVFISNASKANTLATPLSQGLRRLNIAQFHYKDPGAIPAGDLWKQKITEEVSTCDVFVALIGDGYDRSKWCKEEMRLALERKDDILILPYNVDGTELGTLTNLEELKRLRELQVDPLPQRLQPAVGRVIKDVDDRLKTDRRGHNAPFQRSTLLGASRELIIDAIRHMSRVAWKEFQAMLQDAGASTAASGRDGGPPRPRESAERIFEAMHRADAMQYGAFPSLVSKLATLGTPRRRTGLLAIARRVDGDSHGRRAQPKRH